MANRRERQMRDDFVRQGVMRVDEPVQALVEGDEDGAGNPRGAGCGPGSAIEKPELAEELSRTYASQTKRRIEGADLDTSSEQQADRIAGVPFAEDDAAGGYVTDLADLG